ncbi:P68 family surface lipoprotein [[Mycoplasma] imitans]|uniref:P68 family surface lipoprotein n=1 Tax=[Mycoplasma] imitans TaxID=29560 RepID=UPI0004893C12|nr:hypothetical protein [[Mycoplasma] imitans]
MKLIKKLSFALLTAGLSGVVVTSCGSFNNPNNKPEKTVLFQSAQNSSFPLDRLMQSLVDTYNNEHKNDSDFLKVVYQNSDINHSTSEFNLANSVINKIKSNADNIPNIILSSLSASYLINQFERLLDVTTDNFFASKPFINQVNEVTKNIIGANHITQNALPFDLTDLDALYFNKPVMKKLFALFKLGGGTVDENSKIFNNLKTETTLPADNFWSTLTVKSNEVYNGQTINDQTFDNLESIFKFTKLLYSGLNLTNLTPASDKSIFEIDYDRNVLTKYLWNKLGNSENDFLWTLKADPNDPKDFAVNFDNLSKESTIKATKDAIQFWYDNIKVTRTSTNKDIRSIKLNNSGRYGFSFNDIRNNNAAFALGPTVTLGQATISKYTIDTFIDKTNKTDEQIIQEAEQKFVHPDDVYWSDQLTKMDSSYKHSYIIGGSYLVPISSSDQAVNKATINFLKYLYSSKNAATNNSKPVIEKIEDGSGYFVPLKNNFSEVINSQRQDQLGELAKQYNFSMLDMTRKVFVYKNKPEEWDSYYFTQAGLITRNGLDSFLKNSENYSLVDAKNDSKTAAIFKLISDNVLNSAVYNSKVKTPDEIMSLIAQELDNK